MRYRMMELELSGPAEPITMEEDEQGLAIIGRLDGRLIGFHMRKVPVGGRLSGADVQRIADQAFAYAVLESRVKAELPADNHVPLPSVTVAICTKDRAARLSRLLTSLVEPPQ